MKQVIAKPQLGFTDAVKLAYNRLTEVNGRSRRSEFWWFMLAFAISYYILSTIISAIFPLITGQIITALLMIVALPVTIRRLQDTGKSKWWVILSWLSNAILSIYIIQSGFIDALNSVNADIEGAVRVLNLPFLGSLSLINIVTSLCTFIFCLLDGKPEANKYGPSPKYEVTES